MVIVLGVAWGWRAWSRAASAAAADTAWLTATVERGDVRRTVVASGTLNPLRSVQVGSQISGVIVDLPADFNQVVRRGDVVARIDTATFEANVRLAEAELASAKAAEDLARFTAERQRSLSRNSLVSESDIVAAEVALRQAESTVRIREENLERARLELARCTIVSPTDGIVISRNVDVGQTVAASLSAPVLFEIAEDLSRMMINARISEAEIGRIQAGQAVEFRVDAYRDERRRGRVVEVRMAPIIDNNVVTYDTVIHVDNPDHRLYPGMTAEVAVVTDERRDVLRVRNLAWRALLPAGREPPPPDDLPAGARVVYRLADPGNPASLVAVIARPGLADLVYTEVLDGLAAGDVLVTGVAPRRAGGEGERSSIFRGAQARY